MSPAIPPSAMQRPSGPGTAFSIDSLIGPPPPRSGHLLYTGYPMFMPYRPLVLPHAPLQPGLPPLAPLASFAGRLTNTFCASLGQAVPSMVALTTALPSFSEPPDGFYPAQELSAARTAAEPGCRRQAESLEAEELPPARDKGPPESQLHFPDPFPSLAGESRAGRAPGPFRGILARAESRAGGSAPRRTQGPRGEPAGTDRSRQPCDSRGRRGSAPRPGSTSCLEGGRLWLEGVQGKEPSKGAAEQRARTDIVGVAGSPGAGREAGGQRPRGQVAAELEGMGGHKCSGERVGCAEPE
uniref:Gastrulation brain homeobox 1 n=1 Tax=Pelusios castaneus TaxID=367368 RepID=A0A8C8S2Q4_9SAUR